MTLSVTIDDVMGFHPCGCDGDNNGINYTRERVTELFAGRESVSASDVLDAPISDEDKLWLVLRSALLPEPLIHSLACDFAASVLWIVDKYAPGESRPRNAIETKRRWIRGEATDGELAAAMAAAMAAARDAARDAAMAAAMAAARDAARDAAMAAAMAAARDAARDAAYQSFVEMVRTAIANQEGVAR